MQSDFFFLSPNDKRAAFIAFQAFFSDPFVPSSIVLGAASPGKASSNGEDYIGTITARVLPQTTAQGSLPVAPSRRKQALH